MTALFRSLSVLSGLLAVLAMGCGGSDDDKATSMGPTNGEQSGGESEGTGGEQKEEMSGAAASGGEISGELLSEPNSATFTITYQPSGEEPLQFTVTHHREWSMAHFLAELQSGTLDYPEVLVLNDAEKKRLLFWIKTIPPEADTTLAELSFYVLQESYGKKTLASSDILFPSFDFGWEEGTPFGTSHYKITMVGFAVETGEITFSRFSTKSEGLVSGTLDLAFKAELKRGETVLSEGQVRIQGTFTAPVLSTDQ